jgi:purine-cytosine permease-like protein
MTSLEPAAGIERRSIDFVPHAERHGRAADQGIFWFLGNFHFFTIAVGFIGPSLGLDFWPTASAGAVGILIGTVFQAFHASQGAELGLPQMIQSRAQFGFRGVIVPVLASFLTFLGFNIADSVLLADGARQVAGVGETHVILAMAVCAAVLAIWGHDWLHRAFRILFWLNVPLISVLTCAILLGVVHAHPAPHLGFSWVAWLAQLAAAASYNITYAPYVSDYSRYLPHNTGRARIIAYVFAGSACSAIWLITLGAWLAARFGQTDGMLALLRAGESILPGAGVAMALLSAAALAATMGMNAYSGMLSVLTAADAVRRLRPTRAARIVVVLGFAAAGAGGALLFHGDAIDAVNSVLVVLLYLLVPWTAINLTDYFFITGGRYEVADMVVPGGIYPSWDWRGLVAYAVGFAASLPFAVVPLLFTGPVAHALGDVDLGWLVGLGVAGGSFWVLRGKTNAP